MRDCNTEAASVSSKLGRLAQSACYLISLLLSIQKSGVSSEARSRTRRGGPPSRGAPRKLLHSAEGKHPTMIRACSAMYECVGPLRARVSLRREDTASKNAWHAGRTPCKNGRQKVRPEREPSWARDRERAAGFGRPRQARAFSIRHRRGLRSLRGGHDLSGRPSRLSSILLLANHRSIRNKHARVYGPVWRVGGGCRGRGAPIMSKTRGGDRDR